MNLKLKNWVALLLLNVLFNHLYSRLCTALQKFRDRHGRPPYPASRQDDVEQLKLLLEEVIQELSVPRQLVNDEFTK